MVPHLYVVGPDGMLVNDVGSFDGATAQLEAPLPEGGTYIIAVADDSDSGGDYTLNVYDIAAAQG
jgi:hypothetical protein